MPDSTGMWSNPNVRACPRCDYPMLEAHHQSARIDHCNRCGGSLIEPGQMAAHVGHWAEPAYWKDTLGRQTMGAQLPCPGCHGTMTGFQVPWGGRSVVVDHCDTCGALWFDHGEAQKLVSIVQHAEAEGAFAGGRDSMGRRYAGPNGPDARYDIDHDLDSAQNASEKPGLPIYLFQLFTGMPVEVWNPVRNRPVITPGLVALLVFAFVLEFAAFRATGPGQIERWMGFVALVPEYILDGRRLWSLVTYMFLHAGIVHLLGNLYFLHIFGDNVEDRLGRANFVVLYLSAGLLGGVMQVIFTGDPTVPVVGASGAIAGLMGAYLVLFPRVKVWMVFFFMHWRVPILAYLGVWVAFNIAGWHFGGKAVAWWAHLGGFAAGMLLAYVFKTTPAPKENAT